MIKISNSKRIGISLLSAVFVCSFAKGESQEKLVFSPIELNKCDAKRKRDNAENKNKVYDRVYSAYIEICASSTWQKRGDVMGGNLGHTFTLIRGACLQRDQDGKVQYPQQLTPCDKGVVSVSTDFIFKNTSWIATEGRDFALYGEHPADKPFDHKSWMEIQKKAYDRGFLDTQKISYDPNLIGNVVKDAADNGKSLDEWIKLRGGDMSAGTDFVIAAARGGVDCTRIPLVGTKPGYEKLPLLEVIEEFNAVNRDAHKNGFVYNNMFNSCVTPAANVLAQIGFWPRTNTKGSAANFIEAFKRRADIKAPYNVMFNAFEVGSQFEVVKIVTRLLRDPVAFTRFKKSGWLPYQVGTMLEVVPPLQYRNEIYHTDRREQFLGIVTSLKELDLAKQVAAAIEKKTGVNVFELKLNSMQNKFDKISVDEGNPAVKLSENIRIWNQTYKKSLSKLDMMEKAYGVYMGGVHVGNGMLNSIMNRLKTSGLGSSSRSLEAASSETGEDSLVLESGEFNPARRARFSEVVSELRKYILVKISETEQLLQKPEELVPSLNLTPVAPELCLENIDEKN